MMCQDMLSILLLSMAEGKKSDRRRTTLASQIPPTVTTLVDREGTIKTKEEGLGEWPVKEMIAILGRS
jgi:hypothetical protein